MGVLESELVQSTFTIRKMRLPQEVLMTRQSLLRWTAISLGLLSEDETRQSVVPVLDSFLRFQLGERRDVTIRELAESLAPQGVPEKAVRYHLGKLVEIGIVEERQRRYSLKKETFSSEPNLAKLFREHYSKNVEESLGTIEKALQELQRSYS